MTVRQYRLADDQVDRIHNLLNDYLDEVIDGQIVGYGQPREDEILDIRATLLALRQGVNVTIMAEV